MHAVDPAPSTGPADTVVEVEPAPLEAEENDCAICLVAPPALTSPLRTTPCGHIFCEHCLSAYAFKRPPGGPVPCPLCRAPLRPEVDIPPSHTISFPLPASRQLGMTLESEPTEAHARIVSVMTGSSAAAAGLRAGMRVLAVDDVAITLRDTPAEVGARITRSASSHVQVRIGWLRPAADDEAQTMARMQRRSPPQTEGRFDTCWFSCICWCNVMGQLTQHVLHLPKAACWLIGGAMWLLFLTYLVADTTGSMVLAESNDTSTVTASTTKWLTGTPIPPDDFDSSDGLSPSELSFVLSVPVACPALMVLWLLGSSLLKLVRDRVKATSPALWNRAMDETPAGLAYPWYGPFCACCCLSARLMSALMPRGPLLDAYQPCLPLRMVIVDEEAELV